MRSLTQVLKQLSYTHTDLPEIIQSIEANYRILICMRGAPGSGKSHLARAIVDATQNGDYANHIFSTDSYFIDTNTGQYTYDRLLLKEAHEWNQKNVAQRASSGWSPIIVDNTNMQFWEMAPYFRAAISYSYLIRILEPNTPWRITVDKLVQRNSHGAEQMDINRMLNKYEPGNVEDVLRTMGMIEYNPKPQLRRLPSCQES